MGRISVKKISFAMIATVVLILLFSIVLSTGISQEAYAFVYYGDGNDSNSASAQNLGSGVILNKYSSSATTGSNYIGSTTTEASKSTDSYTGTTLFNSAYGSGDYPAVKIEGNIFLYTLSDAEEKAYLNGDLYLLIECNYFNFWQQSATGKYLTNISATAALTAAGFSTNDETDDNDFKTSGFSSGDKGKYTSYIDGLFEVTDTTISLGYYSYSQNSSASSWVDITISASIRVSLVYDRSYVNYTATDGGSVDVTTGPNGGYIDLGDAFYTDADDVVGYTSSATATADEDYTFLGWYESKNNTSFDNQTTTIKYLDTSGKDIAVYLFTKEYDYTAYFYKFNCWSDLDKSTTYSPSDTYTYSGLSQGPTITYSGATSGLTLSLSYTGTGDTSYTASSTAPTNAGTYSLTATIAITETLVNNVIATTTIYAETTINFTIEKAPLTATIDDYTMDYGTALPTTLSSTNITYMGFVNDETATTYSNFVAPTVAIGVTQYSNVGTHTDALTMTIGNAAAANDNYTISLSSTTTADFIIEAIDPTLSASSENTIYGEIYETVSTYATGLEGGSTPTGTTSYKIGTYTDDIFEEIAAGSNVGTYYVQVTYVANSEGTGDDYDNYRDYIEVLALTDCTYTINKAEVTIPTLEDATYTYNAEQQYNTATVNGITDGSTPNQDNISYLFSTDYDADDADNATWTATPINAGTYSVKVVYTSSSTDSYIENYNDYEQVFTNCILINKANIVANSAELELTYGEDIATILNDYNYISYSFTGSENSETLTGTFSLNENYSYATNASEYEQMFTFILGDDYIGNYNGFSDDIIEVSVTINKATINYSATPTLTFIYGETLDYAMVNSADYMAYNFYNSINGDNAVYGTWNLIDTYATGANTYYEQMFTFTQTDKDNYNDLGDIEIDVTIIIEKAELQINSATITYYYGQTVFTTTNSLSDIKIVNAANTSIEVTPTANSVITGYTYPSNTANVGSYTGYYTFTLATSDIGNYVNTNGYVDLKVTIKIEKATITTTGTSYTVEFTYGDDIDTIISEIDATTAFVNPYSNATVSGTWSAAYGVIYAVGATAANSTINLSFNFTADNYNVLSSYVVKATVNKATLTASLDTDEAVTVTYGGTIDYSSLTITYTGFVYSDDSSVVTAPSFDSSYSSLSNVGTYENAITLSGGSANNYTIGGIADISADLIVTEADVTLAYTGGTYTYNAQAQYEDTATVTGVTGGTDPKGTLSYRFSTDGSTWTSNEPINAGTYSIKVVYTSSSTDSYTENYNDYEQVFTNCIVINKAELTVSFVNDSVAYASTSAEDLLEMFELDYTGFAGNDTVDDITKPTVSLVDYEKSSDVGTYTAYLTGGEASNYSFITDTIEFTVVAIDPPNITYASATTTYSGYSQSLPQASATGVDGETISGALTIKYSTDNSTWTTEAPTNVGKYYVSVDFTSSDDNYNSIYYYDSEVVFEITKAILTVSFVNGSVTVDYASTSAEDLLAMFTLGYSSDVYDETDEHDYKNDITTAPTISIGSYSTYSNVGKYDVTVSGGDSDNYTFVCTATTTFTVEAIDPEDITYEIETDTYTYNAKAQYEDTAIVNGVTDGSTPNQYNISYRFSTDGSTWTSDEPINAGTYSIKVVYTASTTNTDSYTENYNNYEQVFTNCIVINKAVLTVSFVNDSVKVDYASTSAADLLDMFTLGYSSDVYDETDEHNYEYDITTAPTISIGSYYIYSDVDTYDVTVAGGVSANYTFNCEATTTFKVVEIEPTLSLSASSAVYTGAVQYSSATASASATSVGGSTPAGTIRYTYEEDPINVGSYNVTVKFTALKDGNYCNTSYTFKEIFTITSASLTITLDEVKEATYDDDVAVSANDATVVGIGSEDINTLTITYEYYVSGIWTSVAPTNVGSYNVRVTASTKNANYSQTVDTFSAMVIITGAELDIDFSVDNTTEYIAPYTGSSITASYEIDGFKNGETPSGTIIIQYSVAGQNAYSTTAPVNVGVYDVRVVYSASSTSNYVSCIEYGYDAITIKAVEVAAISLSSASYTYKGTSYSVSASVSGLTGGSTPKGTLTYTYSTDDGDTWTATPINVGTYWVKVTYKALNGDNYSGSEEVFKDALTIIKATATISVSSLSASFTGEGISAEDVVTVKGILTNDIVSGKITIKYSVAGADSWSSELPVAVGSYDIKVTYEADGDVINFTGTTQTFSYVVTIKTATPTISIEDYIITTYNGDAVEVVAIIDDLGDYSADADGIKIEYLVNGVWSTTTLPVDAGTYDVRVSYTAVENDVFSSASTTIAGGVVINKAQVTVTPTAGQAKEYDGAAFSDITYSTDSELDFTGALTAGNYYAVGSYAITIGTLSAGANYNIELESETVNITQMLVSIAVGTTTFTYDGLEKDADITAVTVGNDYVALNLIYVGDRTNVGTFKVVASANSGNYYLPSTTVTYTIAAAVMSGNSYISETVAYTGSPISFALNSIETGASVVYNAPTSYVVGGVYTVSATVTKTNYQTEILTATLTVVQEAQVIAVSTTKDAYTYGDTPALVLAGAEGKVSFDDGQTFAIGTNAYTWTFTPTDTNYPTQSGTAYITINKAEVTINVPSTATGTVTSDNVDAFGVENEQVSVTISYVNTVTGEVLTYVPTEAGTYNVIVSYEGSDIYEAKEETSVLVIEEKSANWIAISVLALVIILVIVIVVIRARRNHL